MTLKKFESGKSYKGKRGSGDRRSVARKTRWEFAFQEKGKDSENWRVQKMTIRDATGNKWSPYLDFEKQDFTWAKGGTVEMFGALWPSEEAWKFDVEVARTNGFANEEIWQTEVALPGRGILNTPTNSWTRDGLKAQLVSLAAPNVEHKGDFKWSGKWWGDKQSETYSLCLTIKPGLRGHRLMAVGATDENGNEVKIVEHDQDGPQQVVFFRPAKGAKSVTFKFALSKSKTVQFLARPKFVVD